MKRHLQISLILIAILWIPSHLRAFSQATHLYIADHAFQDSGHKNDLYYGSIAPDIDFFVRQASKWPTAFDDTHHRFVDLRSFAGGPEQAAFAGGWLTHNEEDPWGADHIAHIDPGYVVSKAEGLSGVPSEFAHLAIEVAVDVLLKNEDPELGDKLLGALQRHSSKDRALLTEVFVSEQQATDRLTLILAEMSFRQIMVSYARALSLQDPEDKNALAKWGVMLAKRLYRVEVSSDLLLRILEDAIELCKDDYKKTVDAVIEGIKNNPGVP